MAESAEFLEKAKISAGLKILIPWASQAGCAKCRWKVEGSTCCNPEKIQAKCRAIKDWQEKHKSDEEKFDPKVYNEKLKEVYQEIKDKHVSPVALPKVPQKAGGDKDCLFVLDDYYYYDYDYDYDYHYDYDYYDYDYDYDYDYYYYYCYHC